MRRNNIMIPRPRSNFLSVQCVRCEEQKVLFSHATMDVFCNSCGEPIAKKTGARANILGKIINTLD
jgi:small subunit ribosomal protein S27e